MIPRHHACVIPARIAFALTLFGAIGNLNAQSTWSVRASNATSGPLYDIAFGSGKYIAAGTAGEFTSSPDGQNWSAGSFGDVEEDIAAICFGDGQFIAAGQDGVVLRSADGSAWTEEPAGTGTFLSAGVFGCGRFVFVGGGGIVLSSTEPGAWQVSDTSIPTFLSDIAFGDGAFVIVGQEGIILRSTDGLSWAQVTSGVSNYLSGVAYKDGSFVAVGRNGTILVSTDAGLSWLEKISGTTDWLQDVAIGDALVSAVGEDGMVLESSDLEIWSPATSNTLNDLSAVAFVDGDYVAVGGSASGGVAAIITNSTAPLPSFSWETEYQLISEEEGSFQATVARTGSAAGSATVKVQANEHTTEGGTDFSISTTTIDFSDGQTSATVTFGIVSDTIIEGREHVSLELRNPSNGYAVGSHPHLCLELADEEDADGDFLPDAWELAYWPSIETHDGDDDPDGDDNDNLREFEDGTDPTDINSVKYRINMTIIGDGSVLQSPALPCFERGTDVTLEASPGAGTSLLYWSGNISGNPMSNPRSVSVDFDLDITAVFGVSLKNALDNRELTFTTFGSGDWFGQTAISFDEEDSAEAPQLVQNQSATMQSFVLGPGNLSFRWKASCKDGVDSLSFIQSGVEQASITGETDWLEVSVPLAAGLNQLRWVFSRGGGDGAGSNSAWIDQVRFVYPYEAWRAEKFTATEVLDDSISGKFADAENDGMINFLEYLFDYPPKSFNPEPETGVTSAQFDVLGERYFQFFYRIRKGRLDGLDAGMHHSANCIDWAKLANEPTVIADDLEALTYSVFADESIDAGNQDGNFYRFEVDVQQ